MRTRLSQSLQCTKKLATCSCSERALEQDPVKHAAAQLVHGKAVRLRTSTCASTAAQGTSSQESCMLLEKHLTAVLDGISGMRSQHKSAVQ